MYIAVGCCLSRRFVSLVCFWSCVHVCLDVLRYFLLDPHCFFFLFFFCLLSATCHLLVIFVVSLVEFAREFDIGVSAVFVASDHGACTLRCSGLSCVVIYST